VTLSDLAKYSMTRSSRGLSATAELLVKFSVLEAVHDCVVIPFTRCRARAAV